MQRLDNFKIYESRFDRKARKEVQNEVRRARENARLNIVDDEDWEEYIDYEPLSNEENSK